VARILTGDSMVNSVRKRTMTPEDTSTFTDDDILDIIDEELNVQVIDKLLTLHGENLTIEVDVPRDASGCYTIPYRAVGNKLRDISLISGNTIYEMAQISIGELPDYTYGEYASNDLDKFYVQNNKINLVEPNRSYESIRVRYYLRPNFLTKMDKAGVISAAPLESIYTDPDPEIATQTEAYTIKLSSVGKGFTSTDLYDIVGHKSPNKIKTFDIVPLSFTKSGTTGTIIFAKSDIEGIINDIQVGDYVTIAQETPVPNIPTEMHPLLAQAAAVNILESLTDTEALANAERRMEKMTKAVQSLIDDRVELAPKKIKPRHGTLASGWGLNNRGKY